MLHMVLVLDGFLVPSINSPHFVQLHFSGHVQSFTRRGFIEIVRVNDSFSFEKDDNSSWDVSDCPDGGEIDRFFESDFAVAYSTNCEVLHMGKAGVIHLYELLD